jgi:hypothetical protein
MSTSSQITKKRFVISDRFWIIADGRVLTGAGDVDPNVFTFALGEKTNRQNHSSSFSEGAGITRLHEFDIHRTSPDRKSIEGPVVIACIRIPTVGTGLNFRPPVSTTHTFLRGRPGVFFLVYNNNGCGL